MRLVAQRPQKAHLGVTPITTCPHCSRLIEGTCVLCEPGDPHPSCENCVDGKFVTPWYQTEIFLGILTTVVVTVASALIVTQIQKSLKAKKS